ncbi:MAG: L,D-transpeptidase/peptidoglycan binding protein, partial [Clostridia bacterium]|nr:L,D-transpeptidase/peptidoglycan binding protein [Clostridia bacterium]
KDINYQINGTNENNYRKTTLKNAVQAKLASANETRTAPVDAYAQLKDGKVSVVNAKKGNLYDIDKIMKEYDSQLNDNQIKLSTAYVQPLSADSKKIATDKAKLSELSKQKIDYKVQDKTYQLAAADVINSATIKDGKFSFNTEKLNKKIAAINKAQGTLNKNLKFHTTNGNNITLEKGSYGWALSEKKAAKTITTAFKEKKSSVDAKDDTYGEGYNTKGTGYSVTSNNGIGDNYVEISLAQQHVWVYRNGKQVASINIVSGTNDGYYNTPKGLYYVMYKQTNTVLRGRNADNSAYASPVSRWAPFTLDGCGFHDASWRSNWSSTAYLSNGSHGCINIRPSQVNMVYDNITENEPVVIY